MNKEEFRKELAKRLNLEEEKCAVISTIFEHHFFLFGKNKEKVIEEMEAQLEIEKEEATRIYETSNEIIDGEIKRKITHPFGK